VKTRLRRRGGWDKREETVGTKHLPNAGCAI
jgi:hypothetical protein